MGKTLVRWCCQNYRAHINESMRAFCSYATGDIRYMPQYTRTSHVCNIYWELRRGTMDGMSKYEVRIFCDPAYGVIKVPSLTES